jgi:ribosomal protein L34
VLADTLDATTEQNVAELRAAIEAIFVRHSQARRHHSEREVLVLDLDLSPLPTSKAAEGAERGYLGRCRSKTGRKLVRVRAAQYQETLWEDVLPGRTAESRAVVQAAVSAAERLLGCAGDEPAAVAQRAQIAWRLDRGWGSEALINWLLDRG